MTLASAVFMQEIRSVLQHGNHNLATWEKEYLLWHQRLAHANGQWVVQSMMKPSKDSNGTEIPDVIPVKCKRTTTCNPCKCAACLSAKQLQRTTKACVTSNVKGREQAIRGKASKPGDEISCDQFVCSVPGRLPHTKGREGLVSCERYSSSSTGWLGVQIITW